MSTSWQLGFDTSSKVTETFLLGKLALPQANHEQVLQQAVGSARPSRARLERATRAEVMREEISLLEKRLQQLECLASSSEDSTGAQSSAASNDEPDVVFDGGNGSPRRRYTLPHHYVGMPAFMRHELVTVSTPALPHCTTTCCTAKTLSQPA